jgi:purine catabolism regulator
MNVEDIIKFKGLDNLKIIAGEKGINRKVNTVSVMDAPDIYNWLKGGEFLITTGYIMKENPYEIKELIIKIEKAGAAGLGIKLNRFIDALPTEVISIANELNFPIVSIPIKYSFADIINPILSEIVNKQARTLLYSQLIHESFTDLVIKGGSIEKIIKTLSALIDKKIVYYDIYFNNICTGKIEKRLVKKIKSVDIKNFLKSYNNFPVKIEKIYGYIIVYEDIERLGEYDKIAIEHASTVLKLEIQKKISNLQIESRYRDEFVRDLILDNIKSYQEVSNRAGLYNWNFENGNIVIIFDIDNFKQEYLKIDHKYDNNTIEDTRKNIFNYIIKAIKYRLKGSVYTTFSDSIVFIIRPSKNNSDEFNIKLKNICDNIREKVLNIHKFTLTIGIGGCKSLPTDIYLSYNEAKDSVKLGRFVYDKNHTVFYKDLGIYRLFSDLSKSEDGKKYYKDYIGKIIDYDKARNTEFLLTLEYIVKNDWNLKATAEDLYVHYNTIKYRFNKINKILNMNLRDSENKINISVALKLYKMAK